MRGLKSLIAFVLVLAGLGAYIYFVTWKKSDHAPESTSEKVFKEVSAEQVNTLRVKNPAGDTTMVKKIDEWEITAPLSVPADDAEANAMTSTLASTTIDRVVEEKPADLKTYGLAPPRIDVSFKLGNDKEFRHLLIGDKSPTGDLYAMRSDDKRVFLVPGSEEQTFGRSTFELRDKTVLRFDRYKVDSIEVEGGAKPLELVKQGTSWKITKPLEAPADFAAGEGLISRVRSLQMKSIVTEHPTPAELKSFGLDKPSVTVTVTMGSAHASLAVGGKAGDNEIYVRDVGSDMVVKAESLFADDMKKSVDEYRRKDVFEFRAFNATHVEITRDGQTTTFDKVKGPNDKTTAETWRRTNGKAADVDKTKMEAALTKLSDMRIASFIDPSSPDIKKTGLDKPAMTVVVKYDDGKGVKEERATFGKVDTDVFVSRPGEPGAAKLEAVGYADAIKALDDIK